MRKVTRWMVISAFLHLLGAVWLQVAVAVPGLLEQYVFLRHSSITVFHWLVMGWATQMIIGVAYWMFPRSAVVRNTPARFWDVMAWSVFVLLNTGVGLRVIAEPMLGYNRAPIWQVLMVMSAVFQALAVVLAVNLLWVRVVERHHA